MEFSVRSLSALVLLWVSLCVESKPAAHGDINPRTRLRVRPESPVHIHPGQKLTLRCGDEGDEGEQHRNTEYHLPSDSLLNDKL